MRKFAWLAVGLLTAMLLTACDPTGTQVKETSLCSSGLGVVVENELRCLKVVDVTTTDTTVPAVSGNVDTAPVAEPDAAPAADAPVPVADKAADAAPASQPAVPDAPVSGVASCADVDFSSWVGNPYGLISLLDAQTGSTPQNSTSFTLMTQEPILYWTGNYNAGMAPSGFERLIVDGDTGVFCVPSGTEVTVNFVGKYMPTARFNSAATPNQVDDEPVGAACMPAAAMATLLNDLGRADPERFFRSLDSSTNVEGAEYLSARWRPEPLGPKTYEGLVSGANVFWVQEGQVSGVESQDFVLLTSSAGKWAVLNLDSTLALNYAHTGVKLCEGLDLDNMVAWWKK